MVGNFSVQSSPLRVSSVDLAVVEPRLQAVAVEFDLVNPVAAVRRLVDERRQAGLRQKRAGRCALARDALRASLRCCSLQDRGHRRFARRRDGFFAAGFFFFALSLQRAFGDFIHACGR